MELENHLEKNPIQKTEQNSKNQSENAAWEQKPLARKRIFEAPFSRSTLKIERKISHRKTRCLFAPLLVSAWPKSLLQFDFKIRENVWTDLKKDSAPIQFKFFELQKTKRRPLIAPAIAVRLLINNSVSIQSTDYCLPMNQIFQQSWFFFIW